MQKAITAALFGLILVFLAVESYREAPTESGGSYGAPSVHWGGR
ncbi:MAG: hypothetical protein WCJ64_06075 [Rhodospirillaceae bacterium]